MFIKKRFFALFAAITVCFAPLAYAATRTGVSQSRTTNDSENTQRRDTQQRSATKRTNTPDSENAQYRATQSRSTIQRVSASNNNVANRGATSRTTRPTTTARTATTQTRNTSTRTATRPTTTARTATKPNISRAGVTVNNRNVADNAMSREELNQRNEMTEYCREQYALCMDQYCNILDEDMARCSCSANLSNYEKTVNGLEQANAALQDVAQQIQYIGLSADDINTLFSETEAEAALASTSDSTQLKNDLDKIKKMIVDVKPGTSSSVDTKSGGLNLDLSGLLSFSFDDSDFSLDSIFGNQNNTSNIINQRGTTLHKTATQRCQSSVLTYCKDNGVDTAEVINSYDLKITKDCIAYEQNLNSQNKNMASTIRNAHNVLQKARLMVKQNKNTYDLRGCVTALDECMRTDFVCGDNYENCLDPSGKYIVNGEVVLGSTPNFDSMWKYDADETPWSSTGLLADYIEEHTWTDKPTRSTFGDIAEFLQYKIGYNDGKNNYGLCMGVLNQCQNYTYDSDGYIYGNAVVREYLTRILPTIKTAQDSILNEYSENCVTDVKSCLTTNGYTTSSNIAINACKSMIATCMSTTGATSSINNWVASLMKLDEPDNPDQPDTPKTYTITYSCGVGATGTPPVNDTATYGETFTPATNANTCTKTGYTFAGWNDGSTDWTAGTSRKWTYDIDKTFTAQWTEDEPDTPKTYTITYSCGAGATGTPPVNDTATYGETFTPATNANTCTKTGYTFAGWNDGSTDWTAGTSRKWTYDIDKTFTAQWTEKEPDTPKTYTVTYSCGSGATGTPPVNDTATYGETFTPAANTCSKTGYTFAGWNDGSTDWTAGTSRKWTYNSNKTFTAKWTKVVYTVNINYNETGFTGTPTVYIANNSSNIYNIYYILSNAQEDQGSLTSCDPFSGTTQGTTGKKLLGFYTEPSGGNQIININSTNAPPEITNVETFESHCSSGTCTLYAHAESGYYTVTYNCGSDATGTPPVNDTATYGETFTPATNANTCTKTGYTFAGWNDGSTDWTAGTSRKWTYNSNKTFTAKWTANTYTVTLKNGSTPVDTVKVTYDSEMPIKNTSGASLTKPTKTDATFKGYYDASSGGTPYYTNNLTSARAWDKASDSTLYAQWTDIEYSTDYYTVTVENETNFGFYPTTVYIAKGTDNKYHIYTSPAHITQCPTGCFQGNFGNGQAPDEMTYFGGLYTDKTDGYIIVDKYQTVLNSTEFEDYCKTGSKKSCTLYARQITVKATDCVAIVRKTSDTTGTDVAHKHAGQTDWFLNIYYCQQNSNNISSITPPIDDNGTFLGYFTQKSGGTEVIKSDGTLSDTFTTLYNTNIYPHWSCHNGYHSDGYSCQKN